MNLIEAPFYVPLTIIVMCIFFVWLVNRGKKKEPVKRRFTLKVIEEPEA